MVQGSSSNPRDRRRLVIVGGVVAATAVLGIGAWSLVLHATSVSPPFGPRLSINVVAPVEPVPAIGGILEVGPLNDGFDRAALDQPAEIASADYVPAGTYVGEDWPPLEQTMDTQPAFQPAAPVSVATVTTTDPLQDGSRLFGFDRRPVGITPQPIQSQNVTINIEPAKDVETFFE